jgi:hypothetical protein
MNSLLSTNVIYTTTILSPLQDSLVFSIHKTCLYHLGQAKDIWVKQIKKQTVVHQMHYIKCIYHLVSMDYVIRFGKASPNRFMDLHFLLSEEILSALGNPNKENSPNNTIDTYIVQKRNEFETTIKSMFQVEHKLNIEIANKTILLCIHKS